MMALVAEHRLPDGVTSLCLSNQPGMPIMAGTRAGDVFRLCLTQQVFALHSTAHCIGSSIMQGCRQ